MVKRGTDGNDEHFQRYRALGRKDESYFPTYLLGSIKVRAGLVLGNGPMFRVVSSRQKDPLTVEGWPNVE